MHGTLLNVSRGIRHSAEVIARKLNNSSAFVRIQQSSPQLLVHVTLLNEADVDTSAHIQQSSVQNNPMKTNLVNRFS